MASGSLHNWGPSSTGTVVIDSLLTTTCEAVIKSKEYPNDAIFNRISLLNFLNKKSRVTKQGGASILVPLMYGKNTTFKAYSGDDILDTTGQEGLTMAQFQWKSYGGTIKYAGDEIRMNGAEKLHDLAKAKIMQAVMSGKDKLNADLFASTQATKSVSAMPVLVDATSTVAGISSTTYSWWQAQVNAAVGSFATNGPDKLRDLRDDIALCGQGGGSLPDFIVTTQLVKELYEASQVSSYRYAKMDTPDAGHEKLSFSGAEVDMDPNIATGELYMLPSDSLEFVVHSAADWDIGEFQKPPTQDVYIAPVIWMGQLCTSNRRRLGKLTGITA